VDKKITTTVNCVFFTPAKQFMIKKEGEREKKKQLLCICMLQIVELLG
jgi:hypothetical protein